MWGKKEINNNSWCFPLRNHMLTLGGSKNIALPSSRKQSVGLCAFLLHMPHTQHFLPLQILPNSPFKSSCLPSSLNYELHGSRDSYLSFFAPVHLVQWLCGEWDLFKNFCVDFLEKDLKPTNSHKLPQFLEITSQSGFKVFFFGKSICAFVCMCWFYFSFGEFQGYARNQRL